MAYNCSICWEVTGCKEFTFRCTVCNFYTCLKCSNYDVSDINLIRPPTTCVLCLPVPGVYVCHECHIIDGAHDPEFKFCYCSSCDRMLCKRHYSLSNMFLKVTKCNDCVVNGKTRDCLPQKGAKKIIGNVYIPEIADIIFDYYDGLRHYTGEEIARAKK